MPFRLDETKAKIHFVTSVRMPMLINRAARATGKCSNTQYIQHALVEAIARDLELDADDLYAELPTPKAQAATLDDHRRKVKSGESE